jgi:hypothetical protein
MTTSQDPTKKSSEASLWAKLFDTIREETNNKRNNAFFIRGLVKGKLTEFCRLFSFGSFPGKVKNQIWTLTPRK